MIVEMKNAAILTLAKEKLSVLEKLRHLGVMHIKSSFRKDSGDRSLLEKEYESVEKLLVLFSSVKAMGDFRDERNACEIVNEALSLLSEKELLTGKLEKVIREKEALRPWGSFRFEEVKNLAEKLSNKTKSASICSIYWSPMISGTLFSTTYFAFSFLLQQFKIKR